MSTFPLHTFEHEITFLSLCRMKNAATMLLRMLVIALLFLSADQALAQKDGGISQKQQEKRLAKKAKEDDKAAAKADRDGKRRHLSIQSKETRKRMRKNTKRADKRGSGRHRDSFFRRIFKKRG